MKHKYLYGGQPAEVESANGVRGTIIRTIDGTLTFRVYHGRERFTDYEIRHDDLSVTIDENALAAFYKTCPRACGDGDRNILDHSPQVLGLEKVAE